MARPRRSLALAGLLALLSPTHARAEEPAAPPAEPGALVSIDSSRAFTVIERRANEVRGWNLSIPPMFVSTEQWEPACVAPCAVRLDPNVVYRVGGGGVAPSNPFVLPQPTPPRLHVHAGSHFWHEAGLGTMIAGGVAMIVGAVVAGSAPTQSDSRQAAITGAEIAAPGLAVLLAGAVLWVTSRSVVTTEDGRAL